MPRAYTIRILMLILASFAQPKVGIAEGSRFSQLSFPLATPRRYEWDFDRQHNALVLYVKKTTSDEFKNIDNYDETTIKRIVVRDLGGEGTQIKLYLRDRNLRATIAHFDEPFRINVDIYDVSFQDKIDPETGLPMVPDPRQQQREWKPESNYLVSRGTESAPSVDAFAVPSTDSKLLPKRKHHFVHPEQGGLAGHDAADLSSIKSGPGDAWADYPIYIYRLQAALHMADETQQQWMNKNVENARSSAEAMAEFSGKLYDFGHEMKALEGYRQVLKEKSSIFQRAPLHMWRLAEANLGAGNISLADGYYSQFISLFPQSKLVSMAEVRRLDIAAIRAVKNQDDKKFDELSKRLDQIEDRSDADFQGMKAIRRAYWSQPQSNYAKDKIPEISASEYHPLQSSLAGLESFKTQFLARTLLLNNMTHADHSWQERTGTFAADYFRRYKDYGNSEYGEIIKGRLKTKIEDTLAKKAQGAKYDEVISLYEALPSSLQSIRKTPKVAWFIAESYRKLGQPDKAVEFYDMAADGATSLTNRFKSSVWQELLASRMRRSAAASKRRELDALIKRADQRALMAWNEMDEAERNKVVTVMQEPLENAVNEENTLRAPLDVTLVTWELASLQGDASAEGAADRNAKAIRTLSMMARKFKSYGEKTKRQRAVALIKMLRPSQLGNDARAKDLWTQEIVSIAEEMRLENDLLEAGRLYVLAGTESENYENRAETLYKGGLLLYRSGQRQEAIEALQRASEDGNNQFYANLAKERLNRLSN